MADWIDVAPAAEFGPGERRGVEIDGRAVVVVNDNGELFAVADICSHDGFPLGDGMVAGGEIVCPRHGARFCLRTGRALCPPAYEPIATYAIRIENGMVQVGRAGSRPSGS
jgi:3-phenylpropionate/trans-cinnamate dioxygenase ferredoxin subunit